MSKGLVYTSFALLASTLLVTLAFVPLNTPDRADPSQSLRIGQASFFMDSILQDMDRTLEMGTRRALTASTNWVIENGSALSEPGENVSSALINGTISGEKLDSMENVSLNDWTGRVAGIANRSGYEFNASVANYSFNSTRFGLETSYSVEARLEDPVTLASFNRTNTANSTVTVEDLEDPMLLLRSQGRYISKYSRCGYDRPLELAGDASEDSNGTAYGPAEYMPSPGTLDSVDNPSRKVLVVDDVDDYDTSDVNSFEGVAAEDQNSSGGYTTTYAFDTGSLGELRQNGTVLVHQEEVWRSDLASTFETKCYFPSDEGPDPLDRFGNRMVTDSGDGIATLVDVASLPSELRKEASAIGYVYFNESGDYGGPEKLHGVSDNYSWFRLDRDHVEDWNAESILK